MTVPALLNVFKKLQEIRESVDKLRKDLDDVTLKVQRVRESELLTYLEGMEDRDLIERIFAEAFGVGLVTLRELETLYAERVLKVFNGNKRKAAELLGIDPKTLYVRLRKAKARKELERS